MKFPPGAIKDYKQDLEQEVPKLTIEFPKTRLELIYWLDT